jgi:flagellar basal body-associated protein FliL
MLFMRTPGKLLFPHLPPDQRRKRMNTILLVALVVLFLGGTVGAVIFLANRH